MYQNLKSLLEVCDVLDWVVLKQFARQVCAFPKLFDTGLRVFASASQNSLVENWRSLHDALFNLENRIKMSQELFYNILNAALR